MPAQKAAKAPQTNKVLNLEPDEAIKAFREILVNWDNFHEIYGDQITIKINFPAR